MHNSKRLKTASGSVTPKPHSALSSRDWNTIRQRTFDNLFSADIPGKETMLAHLRQDIARLSHATDDSNEATGWVAAQKSVIALCKVLLYIKEVTLGQNDTVDLYLDAHKAELEAAMSENVKEVFVSLLEELDQANKWKAYSEEVKIRVLLWDKAEEYMSGCRWSGPVLEEEMESTQSVSVSSSAVGTVDFPERGLQAGSSSGSEGMHPETDTAMPDTSGSEGFLGGDTRSELESEIESERDERGFLTFGSGTEDDDDDDDGDDDDDDDDDDDGMDGSGDDSDDEVMPLSFADLDGSDEEQSNTHNISGGDAPLVYPVGCFTGHANNETVKDCGFLGSNDEYIWSGSDCGHFFVWSNDERRQLKGIWKGDSSVVNVLSPHPTLPICAVSGIDETVKIFGPVSRGSKRISNAFNQREEIMAQNSRHET
jgi:hypothetical protein